jgi:hypothetical protein
LRQTLRIEPTKLREAAPVLDTQLAVLKFHLARGSMTCRPPLGNTC